MRIAWFSLPFAGPACDGSLTSPTAAPCAPPMEVACGVGEGSFTPLADGDPVPVVLRPAGGWVVFGAVSVSQGGPEIGLAPRLSLPDAGGVVISTDGVPLYRAPNVARSECAGEYWSVEAYVQTEAIDPDGDSLQVMCEHVGARLGLSITVEDRLDPSRTAECEVVGVVTLEWDPLLGDLCAGE